MSTPNFVDFQKAGQRQFEAFSAASAAWGKGLQDIAAESSDFSKKTFTAGAATMEKLIAAKSVESAVQLQSEFAKAAFDSFVAQTNKIAEIVTKLASESMKPVESAMSKAA